MDIRELRTITPVEADFHGLPIVFNKDAFTGNLLRRAAEKFRQMFGKSIDEPLAPEEKKKRKRKAKVEVVDEDNIIEQIAKQFERTADRTDRPRDYFAALLAGTAEVPVLMSWELTDNDVPVPCNEEGLKRLEGKMLQDLYEFVRDFPLPTLPETPTTRASQTTSGIIEDGSPTPETPPGDVPHTSQTIS